LLVYAAAVEHRERVSELERRQLAERPREEVGRRQIRTVESDAVPVRYAFVTLWSSRC